MHKNHNEKNISGHEISLDLNCHFMPLRKITIDYDNKVLLGSIQNFLPPLPIHLYSKFKQNWYKPLGYIQQRSERERERLH